MRSEPPSKCSTAFDRAAISIAMQLQRDRKKQHAPAKESYFHIPKQEERLHSLRIARAAI